MSGELLELAGGPVSSEQVQLVTLVLPFVILIGLLAWHFRRFPLPVSINQPPSRAGQRVWRVAAYALWSLGVVTIATYDRRELKDFDRFQMAASQIVGKRLTWKQTIGMQDDATWAN